MSTAKPDTARRTIRVAVYARKSSEEGLDQPFNSLDTQREAAEAYITSQRNEGWVCLPERYEDGGYSGGNMERPALQRLLRDIEAGKVDLVATYKIDRLSRSLMDFSRILETFERHQVSFVSVTQRFSTADSMGRLMMNVLLSFAQFEREIIGERIRDKIAAQRRKGRWTGGTAPLGYDVERSGDAPRLVVNPTEAARVREIFRLYLDLGSLLPVVQELGRRGWTNKAWLSGKGTSKGGRSFDRPSVHAILTNPIYVGMVRHKKDLFPGVHDGLVERDVYERVQVQLQRHGRSGGSELRNKHAALLRGLLCCRACGCAMSHTFTTRGAKKYRYYACCGAKKRGRATCPAGSLPAAEIERAVLDEVRTIAGDPALQRETLEAARALTTVGLEGLAAERRALERALGRCQSEIQRLAGAGRSGATNARVADLHEQVWKAERRLAEIAEESARISSDNVEDGQMAAAFTGFDGMWAALSPKEQSRVLRLLVARVEFDAETSRINISFHAAGIQALAGNGLEAAA